MRNPRPCKWCGLPKALHWMLNACGRYEGVERSEPLRAKREDKSGTVLVDLINELEAEPDMGLLIEQDGQSVAVMMTWDAYQRILRLIT